MRVRFGGWFVAMISALAISNAPATAQTQTTDTAPQLEAAPRIEMKEFRAFGVRGSASITGNVLVQTKLFGSRSYYGANVYLIPDTSYSTYVMHVYRDAWLGNTSHPIDRGVSPYILKIEDASTSKFTFSKLPPGKYLIFAEIADSAAESTEPCIGKYPGFDSEGRAVNVPVPVYCYKNVRRDLVFMDGSVSVAAGEAASVSLVNDGEVTST